MPGAAREALLHQASAFNTLLLLMKEKGIRCSALDMSVVEEGSPGHTAATPPHIPELPPVSAPLTLSQRASRTRLSRVASCCLEVLAVHERSLDHLPLGHQLPVTLKDSIEFRNICTHMALQRDVRMFDLDLKSAQESLITIITNMTWDKSANSCDFCDTVRDQLKQILHKLQED